MTQRTNAWDTLMRHIRLRACLARRGRGENGLSSVSRSTTLTHFAQ